MPCSTPAEIRVDRRGIAPVLPGDPLVIERDDNDIDRVVLYRIDRDGSETRELVNQ